MEPLHSISGRFRKAGLHLEQDSILFQTLVLFGSMAALAVAVMGGFIWWVRRAGRTPAPTPPR